MTEQEQQHFSQRVRRYFYVFYALVLGTLVNACASYVPFGNHQINVAVALCIAAGEACLAASFFMHLISERKLVYGLLAFTACFFLGLMFLTGMAYADHPQLTITH
jgi:cytochrome c oxidase subunit IV